MSWGESFLLGGRSIWMSDVFIEEWLALRKLRWILHLAFKSNGMQMSRFWAAALPLLPLLLLPSWLQAAAFVGVLVLCSVVFLFLSSSTCCLNSLGSSLVHVILDSTLKDWKTFIILFPSKHSGLENGWRESENLVPRCSEIMRSCCSIEPEVVLLNVRNSLSRIQQPLRKSLIYWSKHIKPVAGDLNAARDFKWEVNVTFLYVN